MEAYLRKLAPILTQAGLHISANDTPEEMILICIEYLISIAEAMTNDPGTKAIYVNLFQDLAGELPDGSPIKEKLCTLLNKLNEIEPINSFLVD